MTLISLLLVLSIERLTTQSSVWQADRYVERYFNAWNAKQLFDRDSASWWLWAALFLPAVGLFFLLELLDNGFFSFVISTVILMVCVGCPALRSTYKCYLQAANRGDMQACSMYADQLGHNEDESTFGENLVWLNYQHYAAIVILFAVFGAGGAVLYVVLRGFNERLKQREHDLYPQSQMIKAVVDWVPVRITALGFLLVGHFSRALPVWLGYFADPAVSAKSMLSRVSKAAEDVDPHEGDCTEEPCTLVKLAKRNVMFILVVISVLTLSGWID